MLSPDDRRQCQTSHPGYVAEHVDLGYAITAHRAQGMTVDTAHVLVTGSTTRENFYVAMTRGRQSNSAYVALDCPDDSHAGPSLEEVTAKTVLFGVLQHSGVELSAHQTIEVEQEYWSSFAQVTAEYLTIATEAQHDRWVAELGAAGLDDEQLDAIVTSDSFGPLAAELRRAESSGVDIAAVLPKVVSQRSLDDAEDIGAVLVSRLRHAKQGRGVAGRGWPDLLRASFRLPTGACLTRCAQRCSSAKGSWRSGHRHSPRLPSRTGRHGSASWATRRQMRGSGKSGCRRFGLLLPTATYMSRSARSFPDEPASVAGMAASFAAARPLGQSRRLALAFKAWLMRSRAARNHAQARP